MAGSTPSLPDNMGRLGGLSSGGMLSLTDVELTTCGTLLGAVTSRDVRSLVGRSCHEVRIPGHGSLR